MEPVDRTEPEGAAIAMEKTVGQSVEDTEIGVEPLSGGENDNEEPKYLKGWPLQFLTASLCLALLLPNVETTITATSLAAITNALSGLDKGTWIITSYLLTYTGFLIVWGKLSDIFGRKSTLMLSLAIFTVFSGGCALAQNINQLIILRAFQGIGASGTYAVVFAIFFELVPPVKIAPLTSMVSGVLALGLVAGPLLGGVINNFTTWRWVFLLGVIWGAVSMAFLVVALPSKFPYHGLEGGNNLRRPTQSLSRETVKRVDFPGVTLLLAATILLIAVLEEAGLQYAWKSAFSIVILIASIVCWILFLVWSWKVTTANGVMEPVFPWRFMQNRICIGLILCVFFTGGPLTVAIIQIPLRFQVVNGLSPLQSGIRLLPFIAFTPVGSVITAGVAGKAKVPPVYLFIGASMLQTVGFALMSTLPTDGKIHSAQYGYQVLCGFAIGSVLATLTVLTPFCVEPRDRAVAVSAQLQFRLLGGALGLSVVTAALNTYLTSHLKAFLSGEQIDEVLKSTGAIRTLSASSLESVLKVFMQGYNLQMKVMIGFSAVQIPLGFLLWKRKQIVV